MIFWRHAAQTRRPVQSPSFSNNVGRKSKMEFCDTAICKAPCAGALWDTLKYRQQSGIGAAHDGFGSVDADRTFDQSGIVGHRGKNFGVAGLIG